MPLVPLKAGCSTAFTMHAGSSSPISRTVFSVLSSEEDSPLLALPRTPHPHSISLGLCQYRFNIASVLNGLSLQGGCANMYSS